MVPDPIRRSNTGYLLSELEAEWSKYVAEYEHNRHEDRSSGGLIGRAYSLFKLDFDYELADSVSEGIKQLSTDWNFLDMLVLSIWKWSDADELLQQSTTISAQRKINACGHEIDGKVKACDFGKMYIFNRPKKLFIVLGECQRTVAILTEEILGALEHISSLTLKVNHPHGSFCEKFIGYVLENLQSIMSDGGGYADTQICILHDELELIQQYLYGVGECIVSSRFVANHAFVTHVVSVVVRIANQSCDFWFNRKDGNISRVKALGLVNLQHQIDPANPKFMKLIIKFQEALYNDKSKKPSGLRKSGTASLGEEAVGYFARYILNACRNKYIDKRLMSLVTLLFTTTLRSHSHRVDVHCLFAEIEVLLAEAAILHRAPQKNKADYLHSCSYSLDKICILETEFVLKEQLSLITSSMPFSDNQILKVEKILNNLRRVTTDLCRRREAEYGEQDSALTRELDGEVRSLYKSLQLKKMTGSMIKHSLLQLLFKIVFFKAESFLSELSKSLTGKYQIESFKMELKYLKRVVSNQLVRDLRDEEILLFMQVEAVVRRVSLLSYSFLPDNDKFEKVVLLLPDLLNKVKDIKGKLEVVSSLVPSSNFPKTFELGFIDFVARNIREVLKYNPESVRPLDNLLKQAQSYLDAFKSILIKVSDSNIQKGELNGICTHFMELAYKVEYVIESIEVDGHLEHSLWLYDLLEDIRLVSEQASKISERSSAVDLEYPSAFGVSCKKMSKDTTPAINQMNVDLVDEQKAIIDLLMRGSSRRDVVSIVGMPGIGKTTLAEKVYNDKNVICHFPRRAWCNVSQVYSKRDLLLDLLSGVHGNSDKFHGMSDEDLLSKLRRCLLGSRYLIVLDDMWDTAAWDDMQISFPEDRKNGSRILITSRLRDVHSTINPGSDPHFIRSLSDDESWMLLEKKIFKGVDCPSELLHFGKKIAKRCQGLPLAIVAVAGLLQKTEKTQDWWGEISNSMSSQLMNDPNPEIRCREILELSYKHLPEYLKACFLYIGVFLRDKEFPVRKLAQLWLAEGFLQENESKSLEVVAHDNLMELINRSLVIISKTRSDGEVKTCRLHDLLRDLCHSKARDENFLHLVTGDDEPYASFPDSDYDMQFHRHKLDPVTFESYRLSIFLRRNHFIDSKPSGPRTRSLIFFASVDKEPRCPYEISLILKNFKLLRVLHLECINMGVSFPAEIELMVQLRYLALSGYMQSIPPSIAKLWKLQTLVVRGFRGTVILPCTIWGMTSLRHLLVNEHVSFNLEDDEDYEHGGSSFCLENLVSFCTPALSFGDKTINILRRFPNLLKMRCIFLESQESSKSCNEFPVLDFLSQLEALKIIYHGRAVDSGEFILPLSLKKLTLSNFRLPWKHISRIGDLPNLKVLKLLSGAFDGPKWEMNEDEFLELEFLKLDALNIAEWIASDDNLPRLKRLVVQNCKDLEEIPQDFASISTLEVLEVQWCTKALEDSAKKIGDLIEVIKVVTAHN